ncbi:ABC transporter related protein, partial [mine drainage metagenome]
ASILSPELLREVWGIVAELRQDPATGLPYLLPTLPGPVLRANPLAFEGVIHIVGGGGAARELLQRLHDEGFLLSLGAVHLFDSDSERARDLGIPSVVETPFAPLSEAIRERHRELISASRGIVVAPFAVGPGNLANLQDLADAAGPRPMALYEPAGLPPRDFTGGRADRLIQELRNRGAVSLSSLDEVARWADRIVSLGGPDRSESRSAPGGGSSPGPPPGR